MVPGTFAPPSVPGTPMNTRSGIRKAFSGRVFDELEPVGTRGIIGVSGIGSIQHQLSQLLVVAIEVMSTG
jgi:hypothetical protein